MADYDAVMISMQQDEGQDQGFDPRTGEPVGRPVPHSGPADVDRAARAAAEAAPALADLPLHERADLLRGVAAALEAARDELVPLADTRGERRQPEQPPQRKPADGDDQAWPQQLELPVAPEGAELLLARRRRPVAAARCRATGIAARDRGAVEGCVELVLLELEPTPERPAGAPAPGQALFSFDDARRLAEEIRALLNARRAHRQRLERVAGLGAGAAAGEVALERGERAVGGLAGGHRRGA